MGNGNNMSYVSIVVQTCTGDAKNIRFDRLAFRDSREEANKALADLSIIGMGGNDMSWYRNDTRVYDWIKEFPATAHIVSITMAKVNRESDAAKQVSAREYTCEHTLETA